MRKLLRNIEKEIEKELFELCRGFEEFEHVIKILSVVEHSYKLVNDRSEDRIDCTCGRRGAEEAQDGDVVFWVGYEFLDLEMRSTKDYKILF